MSELDWSARVELTRHARERCADYLGRVEDSEIRGEIRTAILAGRIAEHVPNWTRRSIYPGENDGHTRYVWDETTTRCWVVVQGSGTIFVKTLLLDHEAEREINDSRHVRRGYRASG